MRRHLSLALFGLLALPTLLAVLLINLLVHTALMRRIDQQVTAVHRHVESRFADFDMLLRHDEAVVAQKMKTALPEIAREIAGLGVPLAEVPVDTLQDLARRHGVDHLYLIDRRTVVVNTDFAPDLGFELGTISTALRDFLGELLGSGRVVVDRINVSSKTGALHKYGYYGPPGADYVVEASVVMKDYLARTHSTEYADYLFGPFFRVLTGDTELLREVEIFRVNDLGQFPFFDPADRLAPAVVAELRQTHSRVRRRARGRVELYSPLDLQGTCFEQAEFMVLKSTFDTSTFSAFARLTVLLTGGVLLATGGLAFLLVTRFLNRFLVHRVNALNAALLRVGAGDYTLPIEVEGDDELSALAKHADDMQNMICAREREIEEAKRALEHRVAARTLELKQRNTELERALNEVKQLSGLLPICSMCKKIRDEQGHWEQLEWYIHQRSEAEFSHGICPDCLQEHYPDTYQRLKDRGELGPDS